MTDPMAATCTTTSSVHDVDMLAEIDLLGDLMVIATSAERPLSQSEIDAALGVASRVANMSA